MTTKNQKESANKQLDCLTITITLLLLIPSLVVCFVASCAFVSPPYGMSESEGADPAPGVAFGFLVCVAIMAVVFVLLRLFLHWVKQDETNSPS